MFKKFYKAFFLLLLLLSLCILTGCSQNSNNTDDSSSKNEKSVTSENTEEKDESSSRKLSLSPYAGRLSRGVNHAGFVNDSNNLFAWGEYNSTGQRTFDDKLFLLTPTNVMSDVKKIFNGDQKSAFIKTDGSLWTYGSTEDNSLGVNSSDYPAYITIDQAVKILDNAEDVDLSLFYGAAVTSSGELYVWGTNYKSVLSETADTTDFIPPTKIMDGCKKAQVGSEDIVVLKNDGTLIEWGASFSGTYSLSEPNTLLTDVFDFDYGDVGGAIKNDGSLYVWGQNNSYDLGVGMSGNIVEIPEPIGFENLQKNVKQFASGTSTAVLLENGELYSFGSNVNNEAGVDQETDVEKPVKILDNVDYVDLGDNGGTAITTSGELYSWGSNEYGQVGDGQYGSEYIAKTPVKISLPN